MLAPFPGSARATTAADTLEGGSRFHTQRGEGVCIRGVRGRHKAMVAKKERVRAVTTAGSS